VVSAAIVAMVEFVVEVELAVRAPIDVGLDVIRVGGLERVRRIVSPAWTASWAMAETPPSPMPRDKASEARKVSVRFNFLPIDLLKDELHRMGELTGAPLNSELELRLVTQDLEQA